MALAQAALIRHPQSSPVAPWARPKTEPLPAEGKEGHTAARRQLMNDPRYAFVFSGS